MGSETSKNWNKVLGLSVVAIVAIGLAFVIGPLRLGQAVPKPGEDIFPLRC